MFKIQQDKKPVYIYDRISKFSTRLRDRRQIKETRHFKTDTANRSFIPRAINDWNNLPYSLRETTSLRIFKSELKSWIRNNIDIT